MLELIKNGVLKWSSRSCRGVTAITFASRGSCIFTSGADGMVCEVDPVTGNLLSTFKASTKAVSSMCVSPGMYIIKISSFGR